MAKIPHSAYTGGMHGYWIIGEYVARDTYSCSCAVCGYTRNIKYRDIVGQKAIICRHEGQTRPKHELAGMTFNSWYVIERSPLKPEEALGEVKIKPRWECRCECGAVRSVLQESLLNGKSTGCGHSTNRKFDDLSRKTFWDWEVIEYNKETAKWKCKCSCGTVRELTGYQLRTGASKSCGHSTTGLKDLTDQTFGEWKVLMRSAKEPDSGGVYWICQCSCGTLRDMASYTLRNGVSRSCGCMTDTIRQQTCLDTYGVRFAPQIGTTRTKEQLEMLRDRESLESAILDNFNFSPSKVQLGELLGVSRGTAGDHIKRLGLEGIVSIGTMNVSGYEKELANRFPCIHTSDRGVLNGKELDLYYPEHQFAIEFNGNYWHSELKKKATYHQEKSIEAGKLGIQVFHIYEYEWTDPTTKKKLISLIEQRLYPDKLEHLQARKCIVSEISAQESKLFMDEYHLQGSSAASVHIGLFNSGGLVGVMTFGRPRFNTAHEWELIRLAFKSGVVVTGGAERLFSHFISSYKPTSIISYCDIGKFTGKVYQRLGFKGIKITKPNYKWVDLDSGKVLPRYKTTKQRLLAAGYGSAEQTEVEIMQQQGFIRIFDSGNFLFSWHPSLEDAKTTK